MKTLTVITPAYFPRAETLALVLQSDVVVWADSFQFNKKMKSNRAAIKSVSGLQWLTVPVLTKGKNKQTFAQMEIDPQHEWRHNHLKSMQVSYQNSPYYFFAHDELEKLLHQEWSSLNDLSIATTEFLCRKMRIPLNKMSGSRLPAVRDRSERVMHWLDVCHCDNYLLPHDHVQFIDTSCIQSHGFSVQTYQFACNYHQLFQTFIENLSGLDLLFNEGEMSRSILHSALHTFSVPA